MGIGRAGSSGTTPIRHRRSEPALCVAREQATDVILLISVSVWRCSRLNAASTAAAVAPIEPSVSFDIC
jgi:hypothetical protein